MNAIVIIAKNTFRQTVRQRVFFNIAIFGVGMVLLSMVVANMTFSYRDRVVRSIGLSGVALAVDLIALLVGTTLIHGEIDKRTLFVVLVRPIRRWQYVCGRYLGLLATLLVALVGLSIVFALVMTAVGRSLESTDFAALSMALPEAAVLGGVGLLLSSFSTPTLSAGIGLGIWLIGASTDDFLALTKNSDPMVKMIAQVGYYVFPSLARFNFRELAIYKIAVSVEDYAWAFAYGGVYCVLLAAIASLILSRRQML